MQGIEVSSECNCADKGTIVVSFILSILL